jgi:hypothetical protein
VSEPGGPAEPPWQDTTASLAENPSGEAERENLFRTPEEKERDQLRNLSYQQDINQLQRYAGRIFWLVVAWLSGTFALLLLQGFLGPNHWFNLDDAVLIAAIGGTTINVIGIFIVVARYLFPRTPDR